MEKVKSVFSNVVAWVKSHVAIVIAVVAVVIVAIVVLNLVGGGASKGAINKYLSAVNSCKDEKILKAMNTKAAVAWSQASGDDKVEKFKDNLDDVDDDDVEAFEKGIKDRFDESDKGKEKIKLKSIVYSTKAKDDKNLTKVVCKVHVTSKPDKEDDDGDDIWKKEKKFTASADSYMTFYLYKNKVISYSYGY